MPRKGLKNVGATLADEWSEKLNKVCEHTSETKADFMKRVINNELSKLDRSAADHNLPDGKNIDIKLNTIIQKLDRSNLSISELVSQNKGIMGGILYLIKITLRSIYALVGHVHLTTKMDTKEYKTFRSSAEKKAKVDFLNCEKTLKSNDIDMINNNLLNS